MQIAHIMKTARTMIQHNSPGILTGIAVAGTFTTALLAAKGGYRAAQALEDELKRRDDPIVGRPILTLKDKAKIVWPLFIPAAGVGVATIACVIGANHVSSKRVAAWAGAYSLTEKAFAEYKHKVVETIGEKKEEGVRASVAEDRVRATPPSSELVIIGNGDVICYEMMTGRYFNSSMEKLRAAENEINAQIINEMYASLNDFWHLIGLPSTGYGEEVGWTTSNLLKLKFSSLLTDKGEPVLAVETESSPIRDYHEFH